MKFYFSIKLIKTRPTLSYTDQLCPGQAMLTPRTFSGKLGEGFEGVHGSEWGGNLGHLDLNFATSSDDIVATRAFFCITSRRL